MILPSNSLAKGGVAGIDATSNYPETPRNRQISSVPLSTTKIPRRMSASTVSQSTRLPLATKLRAVSTTRPASGMGNAVSTTPFTTIVGGDASPIRSSITLSSGVPTSLEDTIANKPANGPVHDRASAPPDLDTLTSLVLSMQIIINSNAEKVKELQSAASIDRARQQSTDVEMKALNNRISDLEKLSAWTTPHSFPKALDDYVVHSGANSSNVWAREESVLVVAEDDDGIETHSTEATQATAVNSVGLDPDDMMDGYADNDTASTPFDDSDETCPCVDDGEPAPVLAAMTEVSDGGCIAPSSYDPSHETTTGPDADGPPPILDGVTTRLNEPASGASLAIVAPAARPYVYVPSQLGLPLPSSSPSPPPSAPNWPPPFRTSQ